MTISIGTSTTPSVRDTQVAWLRQREETPGATAREAMARMAPHGVVEPLFPAVRPRAGSTR